MASRLQIAKFLQKKYASFGVDIFQAFDGFEAGTLMAKEKPGLVILDLDLPGVDGFSLCKKLFCGDNKITWNKTQIAICKCNTEQEALTLEKEIQIKYNLFGS